MPPSFDFPKVSKSLVPTIQFGPYYVCSVFKFLKVQSFWSQTWKISKYLQKLGFSNQNFSHIRVTYALTKWVTKKIVNTTIKAYSTCFFKSSLSCCFYDTQLAQNVTPFHQYYPIYHTTLNFILQI